MSDIFFFVGIVGAQAAVCALLIWLVGKVCSSRCANRHLLVFIIYSVLLGVLTLFGGEFFFLFYPLLNLVFIIHATVLGGVIGWTLIKKKSIKLTILGIVTFIASPLLTIMPPSYAYYRILEGFKNVKWPAYSEDLGGGYRMTTFDGIYYKENEEDNGGQMVIPGGCVNCAYNNQWIIVKTKAPLGFQKQPQKNRNPFIMCKQPQEEKKITNFPLVSYKYNKNNLKYTKYEYRQFNIIQMIILTPDIFITLTDEGLQFWYENNGIQKLTSNFFDKIKSNNNADITNYQLKKFNNDLFFLSFDINQKQHSSSINVNLYNNFNKINELQGLQFILFSANKIIKEGKIIEIFSINKINFAFCISESQVMLIGNDIKIMDFTTKKIIKTDKNSDILKYPITYAFYLTQDLILISSKFKKFSVIYSAAHMSAIYEIEDFIEIAFNLGNDKIILIGNYVKEIIFLPEIQVLSLNQYETDIFGSFNNKTFYPINDNTFFFINNKNRKLKEICLNQENELIIKKKFYVH